MSRRPGFNGMGPGPGFGQKSRNNLNFILVVRIFLGKHVLDRVRVVKYAYYLLQQGAWWPPV